jgi:carboxymethylenebutenolidase
MPEREVTLETPDGPMRTFVAYPAADGPFPIAIVYMDAVGYREQLKVNARRFAADGYYCVVPDLFHHFGENVQVDFGKIVADGFRGPELERMFTLVGRLRPALVMADTDAILAAAKQDPEAAEGPKVCVGYCMGARFSLSALATRADEFVAGACIHPGQLLHEGSDSPHHDLDDVRGEVYLAFASKDENAPPEMVDRLRSEIVRHGVTGTVETIPDTFHGFAMADQPAYRPEAAERHFSKTLDLWRRALGRAVAA